MCLNTVWQGNGQRGAGTGNPVLRRDGSGPERSFIIKGNGDWPRGDSATKSEGQREAGGLGNMQQLELNITQ